MVEKRSCTYSIYFKKAGALMCDRYDKCLEVMRVYYSNNRILPSYSEIMKYTGHKSKSQVHEIIHTLINGNYFKFSDNKKLIPLQKFFD